MERKTHKSKHSLIRLLTIVGVLLLITPAYSFDVQSVARRASVQPVFYIPILKAWFVNPIEKDKPWGKEEAEKMVDEKLKSAIASEREEQAKDHYNARLTDVEKYGVLSPSRDIVPIGIACPGHARFPEKILVVYKVKKETLKAWEKDYEKDVMTLSETLNVSADTANKLISKLNTEGYVINKEKADLEGGVVLLWFDDGWNDTWPIKLDWKVVVEGTDDNIITGYDSRGLLLVTPIPEKPDGDLKRVYIKAGYYELKTEYQPKDPAVDSLEQQVEALKKSLKEAEEAMEKKTPEEKRNILYATWGDVFAGRVKLEQFWVTSAASGVFLGNMKVRDKMEGWSLFASGGGSASFHNTDGEYKGVVLTNAHVADMGLSDRIYVSEDKETLWVIFAGIPFIRYTQDSDMYGSPAGILLIDESPVHSWDYDCSILVTSAVPSYQPYRAELGDSDKIKEGDEVIMVGNPMMLQKFTTRGVIAHTNYSILRSFIADRYLEEGMPRYLFNWLNSSSLWFDTPIGIGGTSGSGVWATEGSQEGKVIALHNMGMVQPTAISSAVKDGKPIDIKAMKFGSSGSMIKDTARTYFNDLFKNYTYRDAKYRYTLNDINNSYPGFTDAWSKRGGYCDVAGMNGGVPINRIKTYLEERGLAPARFSWKGLDKNYWVR